ncbi:MAG: L-amino acid N-acyltransferase YncA [Polaribacter sp.]|jgi:L-amino acid N-acyltransferase YncA
MQILNATPEDYSTIAAIYNEYISLGNATMEEKIHDEKDIVTWVKKFNEREKLYVMKTEEGVIGWGIIKRYSDRNGYRFAGETAVYLTDAQIGKGYGSQMKRFLIEECRKLEYGHLVAKIFAKNEASIQYNLKLGYTIVGTQDRIGFRNNEWQGVTILQLLL